MPLTARPNDGLPLQIKKAGTVSRSGLDSSACGVAATPRRIGGFPLATGASPLRQSTMLEPGMDQSL